MTFRARIAMTCLAFAGVAATAEAQISRVFVSVTGNDINDCSNITTPCRTLGGGIAQVDAQGEVIVISTGSYAGATITKSVKINVASGIVAFSGLAITVDPGAGAVVVLRGLTLKAATPGTGTGIFHQSGVLLVENTVVDGWQTGLTSALTAQGLFVKNSVFRNNALNGLAVTVGNSGPLAVDDSFFEKNVTSGMMIEGGSGHVSNTRLSGNGNGAVVSAAGTDVAFQRCDVTNNTNVGLSAGNMGTLRVAASTITRNNIGLQQFAAGIMVTYGNNVLNANADDIDGAITPLGLQ